MTQNRLSVEVALFLGRFNDEIKTNRWTLKYELKEKIFYSTRCEMNLLNLLSVWFSLAAGCSRNLNLDEVEDGFQRKSQLSVFVGRNINEFCV